MISSAKDTSRNQSVDIEFLTQESFDQRKLLRRVEPHKVVLSFKNKGQGLILVLDVNHHAHLFSLDVQDPITEVEKYEQLLRVT